MKRLNWKVCEHNNDSLNIDLYINLCYTVVSSVKVCSKYHVTPEQRAELHHGVTCLCE